MYETSIEVANLLREMADGLEENRPVAVMLADESIIVPAGANFKVEYDQSAGAGEVLIRGTWSLPVLLLTHSETVQDQLGNLYNVLVYGKLRTDGMWEGWLEFVPARKGDGESSGPSGSVTGLCCGSNERQLESHPHNGSHAKVVHNRNPLCFLRPTKENRHESAVGLPVVSRYLLGFPPRPYL